MTYYDILDGAIAMACENVTSSYATQDYIVRGQYLLANFVTQYAKLDEQYRQAHQMEAKEIKTDIASIDPDDDFPLCDVFIPSAVQYAAAGMVVDENEEMSDNFFDRYVNGILQIRNELPTIQSAIVDKYGLS